MKSNNALLEQLRNRRRELVKNKNWTAALEVINTALMIEATFERHYNRGVILLQLRQFDDAICSFEKSIALNPNFTKGRQSIAKALIMQQNQKLQQPTASHNHDSQKTNLINKDTTIVPHEKMIDAKEYTYSSKIPPLPQERMCQNDDTVNDININFLGSGIQILPEKNIIPSDNTITENFGKIITQNKGNEEKAHSYFYDEFTDSDE